MPTLALSMIVRDEEGTLPACLESVKDLVDEIVIADTGSQDGTQEVARRFGARCVSIPWEDHFARARNRALEAIRCDWVLSMDADEQLDENAKRALPCLLKASAIDGYYVTIYDYLLSSDANVWDNPAKTNRSEFAPARRFPAYIEHRNIRLFRRSPEIYFVGGIHESVGPRIVELGGVLGKADFAIHHFGLISDAPTQARKRQLYRRLLHKKIQEMPQDVQAHLECGRAELYVFHDAEEALKCFAAACQLRPRLAAAWLYQGLALRCLGRPAEALEALRRAESISGRSADVAEGEGDAYYDLQDFDAARRCFERALAGRQPWPAVESKLGLAEVRLGRTLAGLERLREAVGKEPWKGEIHDRLIQACCWLNLVEEAASAADHKLGAVNPDPESFLRAASIHARLEQRDKAALILRVGLSLFPGAERLQRCCLELADSKSGG
ncbi:MAG TPA: glycosyltransferase [Terriglobia bacterium]|nr:glycosyltransferase [Terriglobia bacterium]